jgi:predicted enzyme related to lactoylglutathione lyase
MLAPGRIAARDANRKGRRTMNWTLGVVVPVSDVERAKAFYAKKLGFEVGAAGVL